jgi:uncharacterized membrane protein
MVLAVSLAIRLIGLNQSLWLDEAISANVVKEYSYSELVTKFSPVDFHPPLYYLMLKEWTGVFGFSEISLRMPSVIFSLVTVYFIYLLGGFWPALITGVNPLLIYYSQEARMYAMVTMLLAMGLYFLIKKKYWFTSVLFGISFLTFYGSIFFVVATGIYLLISKKFKEVLIIGVGPLVALLAVSPLLAKQIVNSREMLGIVTNWDLLLGKANLKNLLLIPIKFTSGRISFYPKIIYYLISGAWALFVFKPLALRALPLRKGSLKEINVYSFIFWITLFVGTVFSIMTPMLQYFRFLYLIPVMALVIKKNYLVVGGFVIFSLIYLLNPQFYREDWKSLSNDLPDKVYMISSLNDPIKYYKNINISDIRGDILEDEITVLPYGEVIHGVDHNQLLTAKGYKKIETKNYRELTSERWQKVEPILPR